MADFTLSAAAASDLDGIFDYGVAHWGVDQASAYVASFGNCFALLADFPGMGTARPEIEPGIRSTPHGSHIVYFSNDADRVIIERVLHNRRVPKLHSQGG